MFPMLKRIDFLYTYTIFKFIYFLAVLGHQHSLGCSLVVVSRGYSLVAMYRLLTVVDSPAVEHRL